MIFLSTVAVIIVFFFLRNFLENLILFLFKLPILVLITTMLMSIYIFDIYFFKYVITCFFIKIITIKFLIENSHIRKLKTYCVTRLKFKLDKKMIDIVVFIAFFIVHNLDLKLLTPIILLIYVIFFSFYFLEKSNFSWNLHLYNYYSGKKNYYLISGKIKLLSYINYFILYDNESFFLEEEIFFSYDFLKVVYPDKKILILHYNTDFK